MIPSAVGHCVTWSAVPGTSQVVLACPHCTEIFSYWEDCELSPEQAQEKAHQTRLAHLNLCRLGRHCVGTRAKRALRPDVGYSAAHSRVRKARGRAKDYRCVDCPAWAQEWSYEGGDPDEKVEVVHRYRRRFSLDVNRYSPRCQPCHQKKDRRESRERATS